MEKENKKIRDAVRYLNIVIFPFLVIIKPFHTKPEMNIQKIALFAYFNIAIHFRLVRSEMNLCETL